MKSFLPAAALLALLTVPAEPAAAQCAMCKTALTSSPEGRRMSGTFNAAILVLLAGPYVVVGGLVGVLYRKQIAAALRSWFGSPPRPGA